MSKSISTAWRSPAILGACTFRTTATFDRRATTSLTAAANAGVPACSERFWIRTLSPAGCLKPASRILSIRPDSPGPLAFGSICFVPTWPPMPKATTTSASQPKVAVFQWEALQRPMRAARLRFWCVLRGMTILLSAARRRTRRGGRRRRGRDSGATARRKRSPRRSSSTETVSASSRGCQSSRTQMPSLSRAASSRVCGVAGLMGPPVMGCRPRSRSWRSCARRRSGATSASASSAVALSTVHQIA